MSPKTGEMKNPWFSNGGVHVLSGLLLQQLIKKKKKIEKTGKTKICENSGSHRETSWGTLVILKDSNYRINLIGTKSMLSDILWHQLNRIFSILGSYIKRYQVSH